MSPTLFAALVAATIVVFGVAVAAVSIWSLRAQQQRRVRRRLLTSEAAVPGFAGDSGVNPLFEGIASRGQAIEAALDTENESSRLLAQAGWRSAGQRMAYYSSQLLAPVVLLLGVGGFALVGPPKLTAPAFLLMFAAGALMLGLLLPRMVLRRVAEARQRRIKNEVPMFIHMLVLLFESGLSTSQAFASLVREGRGVLPQLGREIEGALRQVEAGAEVPEVVHKLAEALDVPDLTTVLSLLRQVERYGGEVKEPLLDTLGVIEKRRELDLREQVNLISGRMTVIMVLFFFPALLIFIAGPAWSAVLKGLASVNAR